jgi:hypothetical protein
VGINSQSMEATTELQRYIAQSCIFRGEKKTDKLLDTDHSSYPILSYHIISYHIISYHIISLKHADGTEAVDGDVLTVIKDNLKQVIDLYNLQVLN